MPIYEFVCEQCSDKIHDIAKPLAEFDREELCPTCQKPMQRLISRSSFSLKGGGWANDPGGYASTTGGSGHGKQSKSTEKQYIQNVTYKKGPIK